MNFLVDTGAERSVIPRQAQDTELDNFPLLIAANGTAIKTYGDTTIALEFGPRHNYKWTFIIADVNEPVLGADFLQAHNLLVDIGKKQLVERNHPSINAIQTIKHPEQYVSLFNKYPKLTTAIPQPINTTDTQHF